MLRPVLSPPLLWLKALHLIAMVAWFAGLFYMFRLFVYHTENASNPEMSAVLKVMAERLYRIITTPAMVATFLFGCIMLLVNPAYLGEPWMLAKLVLLVGLASYHGYIGYVRRRFAADDVFLSSRQCRMRNEVPTLFLIAIVLLAVLRPGAT
ncbi:MAG: protoporphyrinogen oxidase HemJ [Deltaproteobacteria bacterium]|nr:MAG: protoporphyrinogen oxidase HemJ [Deltaproteobacteria bacterium]